MKQIVCVLTTLLFSMHSQSFADFDVKSLKPIIQSIEKHSQDIVGGGMAIVCDGRIVYQKAFGHIKEGGALVNDQTLFALASVSKPIVSTALAVLEQKGVVDYEDMFMINGQPFPLKQILSHTTGYQLRGDLEIEQGLSQKDLLYLIKKNHVHLFKPNHAYFYSNFIYALSQRYAKQKGYDLNTLVKLLGSDFSTLPHDSKNRAYPHGRDQKPLPTPSLYLKTVPAAAGLYASLNGMVDFLQILLGNRPDILRKNSLEKLFKPVAKAKDVYNWHRLPFKDRDVQSYYGLGWRTLIYQAKDDSRLIFHSGSFNGATAFVGIIPSQKIAIVVLANQSGPFPLTSGLNLWKAIVTGG